MNALRSERASDLLYRKHERWLALAAVHSALTCVCGYLSGDPDAKAPIGCYVRLRIDSQLPPDHPSFLLPPSLPQPHNLSRPCMVLY